MLRFSYYILVSVILFCCSCDSKVPEKFVPKPDAQKVKIGVIAPLSGSNKTQGNMGLQGIKTALRWKPALLNGDWIELVVEDDQNIPEKTASVYKKLVEKDQVQGVLVMSSSASVLSLIPLSDKYKTPVMALIASHPDIALTSKYMHQVCFDDEFQGKVSALYARDELLMGKVALFVDNENPHSKALADIFKQKFTRIGGTVEMTFPINTEWAHLLDSLKYLKEKDVELLYMPVRSDKFIGISKALNKIGWHPVRMGSDGLMSDVRDKYRNDFNLMEGVLGVDFYSSNAPKTETGEILYNTYFQLYHDQGSTHVISGMEGYLLFFDAMNRSDDFNDRDQINQEIRETIDFEGVMGKISINSKGKALRPLYVNTIKNGKLKFLVKVY